MGGDSPVVALLESLARENSALREALACLKEAAEKVWRGVKWDKIGTCTRDATPSPLLIPRDQDLPPPACDSLPSLTGD